MRRDFSRFKTGDTTVNGANCIIKKWWIFSLHSGALRLDNSLDLTDLEIRILGPVNSVLFRKRLLMMNLNEGNGMHCLVVHQSPHWAENE